MKRAATIALSIFYLFVTAGFIVNLHYCGEVLADVELFAEAEPCCNEESMDCCSEKQVGETFDADQTVSSRTQMPVPDIDMSPAHEVRFGDPLITFITERIDETRLDLPPPESAPLYLLNCSLTYYG